MKNGKKVLSALLALIMVVSMIFSIVSCGKKDDGGNGGEIPSYTYYSYTTSLATNFNPHTWETNADSEVLGYLSSPFVDISILDSENGIYQWVYEMATYIKDVTKDHQSDLTKYGSTLQSGKTAATTTSGYVFEIGLNRNARWQDGTVINADSYIYSLKQLLNPEMKNYRANLYYSGESAIAGASKYYYSLDDVYYALVGAVYASVQEAIDAGAKILIDTWETWGMQGAPMVTSYDPETGEYTVDETKTMPQWVAIDDETLYLDPAFFDEEDADLADYIVSGADIFDLLWNYYGYDQYMEVGADYEGWLNIELENEDKGFSWDGVGFYKVDDYTVRYVTQSYIDINYFMTSMTDTWLVYEPLYEAGKETVNGLVVTNYGTSMDTIMSYGVYKFSSLQKDRQMVFVQNENWYGFEKQDNGALISYTNFEVDGQRVQQYMTTKIVIDVMEENTAKQAFLAGNLSDWTPPANELGDYVMSSQLYKVDQTYMMSLFFNTNLDALKNMDEKEGNKNSVVLTSTAFRKAMSLSFDRTDWVKSTAGYKPGYALMSNLYFYDVYNNPESIYRYSEAAMKQICAFYGVKYGENEIYKTLREAYDSINGYNLTEAKALMKQACEELVEQGLYKAGDEIKIKIAWTSGTLSSSHLQQVALLESYINKAAEGSGFGKITLEAVGNLQDPSPYDAVPQGKYAIGYGAWGGAAFYPFRNMQVYFDTEEYAGQVNETGCWDPATYNITLTVKGKEYTMTALQWSRACIGTGIFADESPEVKLEITAQLERIFLEFYYRIPLASNTSCFLLSYQISYFTENYNIMYDFGGSRLLRYNYTDKEWAEFKAANNNTLNYGS